MIGVEEKSPLFEHFWLRGRNEINLVKMANNLGASNGVSNAALWALKGTSCWYVHFAKTLHEVEDHWTECCQGEESEMGTVLLWQQEQRFVDVALCGSGSGTWGSLGPESRAALQGGSERDPRLAYPELVCPFGAFLFLGFSQWVICPVKDILCEIRAPRLGSLGTTKVKKLNRFLYSRTPWESVTHCCALWVSEGEFSKCGFPKECDCGILYSRNTWQGTVGEAWFMSVRAICTWLAGSLAPCWHIVAVSEKQWVVFTCGLDPICSLCYLLVGGSRGVPGGSVCEHLYYFNLDPVLFLLCI